MSIELTGQVNVELLMQTLRGYKRMAENSSEAEGIEAITLW
jgi:hypothetical protein